MRVVTISCSYDNYSYLIICEESGEAAVVDPTESYPVYRKVQEHNVTLTTVLCTHHHKDHVGDIGQLAEWFPDLQILCHQSDKGRIPLANILVDDGSSVRFGRLLGEILYTPGHTLGSICYRFGDNLFTGDTLFGAGCGRLFEGSPEQMYISLNRGIASLPDETKLFFGHEYTKTNLEFALQIDPSNRATVDRLQSLLAGEGVSTPSTIRLEKETNPFLRCDVDSILNSLQNQGRETAEPLQVFTALRELRNDF